MIDDPESAPAAYPSASKQDRKSWWRTIQSFWPYQRRYWLPFAVASVLLLANLVFDIGMGVVQQSFFAQMRPGHLHELLRLVWICASVGFGLTMLNGVQHFCRYYASAYADRALALQLLTKVTKLRFMTLQQYHSADLVSRIVNDTGLANNLMSSLVYDVLYQVLLGLVAFYYLVRINVWAAIVAMLVGPALFGLGRFFDRRIRTISEDIQARDAAIRSNVQEAIQEMAAVRAYGLEGKSVADFSAGRMAQNRLVLHRSIMQSIMWQLVLIAQGGVQVVSAALVARNALYGNISPGQVMTFVFLMSNVQTPFMRMSQVWNGIQQSLGAADRVFHIQGLQEESTGPVAAEHQGDPSTATEVPAIEIEGVRFTPGGRQLSSDGEAEGVSLFQALDLTVARGETVALVGPSGSGKTSLARLLCGLYQPDSGDVRIFGISTRTHLAECRTRLTYVPQNAYLFSGTIRDNIAFGRPSASLEDIQQAAQAASIHDFIEGLADGYDTLVGEQGVRLSGGQRQRLAIARAFLQNAPLIVLDEPTSALDNGTERAIQAALESLAKDRTVIIIAHRLSTVQNANRIVVLESGRIVEQGSHEALLERGGSYAKLVQLQTT